MVVSEPTLATPAPVAVDRLGQPARKGRTERSFSVLPRIGLICSEADGQRPGLPSRLAAGLGRRTCGACESGCDGGDEAMTRRSTGDRRGPLS